MRGSLTPVRSRRRAGAIAFEVPPPGGTRGRRAEGRRAGRQRVPDCRALRRRLVAAWPRAGVDWPACLPRSAAENRHCRMEIRRIDCASCFAGSVPARKQISDDQMERQMNSRGRSDSRTTNRTDAPSARAVGDAAQDLAEAQAGFVEAGSRAASRLSRVVSDGAADVARRWSPRAADVLSATGAAVGDVFEATGQAAADVGRTAGRLSRELAHDASRMSDSIAHADRRDPHPSARQPPHPTPSTPAGAPLRGASDDGVPAAPARGTADEQKADDSVAEDVFYEAANALDELRPTSPPAH